MKKLTIAMIAGLLLSACSTAKDPQPEPVVEEEQQEEDQPEEADQITDEPAHPEAVEEVPQGEPTTVEFESEDGTKLFGTYYPPAQSSATAVVLMHMLNSRRTAWDDFAQQLYEQGDFAVLSFDFRGHGESEGEFDRELAIGDARAALEYVQTLEGVESGSVVLIGASIGSDAAVDACVDGCIGAASLSPGGWLGVPYADALSAITGKPVLCVASEDDGSTPATCQSGEDLSMQNYTVQLYPGRAHGTSIFSAEGIDPPLDMLLMDWLTENFC